MGEPTEMLIESWLPFEAIGAESLRDASAARKPPLNRLHVWWARRPLTVSRAAILASVLPSWSAGWPPHLLRRFPTAEAYQAWFLRLLGILGDPAAAKRLLDGARQQGRVIPNPYDYGRAFTRNPSEDDVALMRDLVEHAWGTREPSVLDPMAGGGSIPFEALRYGFGTYANELNPVAAVILKATLDYPARFGPGLAAKIREWGRRWYELTRPRLEPCFSPLPPGAEGAAYLWARTVACPQTGKPVPLSPNWWLSRGSEPVAVRMRTHPSWPAPRFEIVRGSLRGYDPSEGTIRRGVARSPWTGEAIDGDYIKREAQAGRMGQMLYAVAIKRPGGFDFRTPSEEDLEAVRRAERALAEHLPRWEAEGLVPSEPFPKNSNDPRPLLYGARTWADLFSPRQLLSLIVALEELKATAAQAAPSVPSNEAAALQTYLALAFDKAAIYNNRHCRFDVTRGIRSIFDRHDFAFVWSHAEFDASANLVPWVVDQVADAYQELATLAAPARTLFTPAAVRQAQGRGATEATEGRLPVSVSRGSAANLAGIPAGSIHHICVDPPYYDNVMYAELSDFFYVWLKRTVGDLFPGFFEDELTNKDDEAVANPARFADVEGNKRELARRDYERKMAACFREMHRVLRDDGVLTVMFTHKQVEAWDTLATALIGAGFTIRASWPVHTESEHSLHQADKNAAASTILLACRKRPPAAAASPHVWWDDIKPHVRRVARHKAEEFAAQGVRGVDLYISTFGPVLSVISERWPVLTREVDPVTGQPLPLRPELALDLAREEVIALRKRGLLLGREVQFDPVTDWYLMAWDAFKAAEFPADEARKLALALGLDVEEDLVRRKRVISKKGSTVVLQPPALRRQRGQADLEAMTFETLLDAAHAAMLVYQEDGPQACHAFLQRTGLLTDRRFKDCLQALLNAIPRTRLQGRFVRPEAEALESLRLAFFDDLTVPADEAPAPIEQQARLWREEERDGEEGEEP